MKDKLILKIAIIIIVFLIIFTVFLIIVINYFGSNQVSSNRASLITTTPENTADDAEETTVDETAVIESENAYTDSIVIRLLVNNNWSRLNSNLSDEYEKDEDGNYVYDGYTLYSDDGVYVRGIIFNQDYEDAVIEGIQVGASYDEVVEAFGTSPTFEDEELNLYGYKTTSVYAFFYDDEISIYPNTSVNNSDFEEILFEYLDGEFDGNITRFVVNVRNNYNDFTAELDGEDVILTSETRQIQIRVNENYSERKVILYNGYKEGNLMEENKENYSIIIEERTIDLVELRESERILAN